MAEDERKQSNLTTNPPQIAAPPPPSAAAPRIAEPAVRSPTLARLAFLNLAALMSATLFVEPFAAAAAELGLPGVAVVATVVLFAALFYASVHLFRSFFLPRSPADPAAQCEGIAGIAAAGVGIVACLVAAGGSAYGGIKLPEGIHRPITKSFVAQLVLLVKAALANKNAVAPAQPTAVRAITMPAKNIPCPEQAPKEYRKPSEGAAKDPEGNTKPSKGDLLPSDGEVPPKIPPRLMPETLYLTI